MTNNDVYRKLLEQKRRNVGKRLAYRHWKLQVGLWVLYSWGDYGRPTYGVFAESTTILTIFDGTVWRIYWFPNDWEDFTKRIRKAWIM